MKYSQGIEIKKLENDTTVLDLEGTEIDMDYIWMIWEEVKKFIFNNKKDLQNN